MARGHFYLSDDQKTKYNPYILEHTILREIFETYYAGSHLGGSIGQTITKSLNEYAKHCTLTMEDLADIAHKCRLSMRNDFDKKPTGWADYEGFSGILDLGEHESQGNQTHNYIGNVYKSGVGRMYMHQDLKEIYDWCTSKLDNKNIIYKFEQELINKERAYDEEKGMVIFDNDEEVSQTYDGGDGDDDDNNAAEIAAEKRALFSAGLVAADDEQRPPPSPHI